MFENGILSLKRLDIVQIDQLFCFEKLTCLDTQVHSPASLSQFPTLLLSSISRESFIGFVFLSLVETQSRKVYVKNGNFCPLWRGAAASVCVLHWLQKLDMS